MSAFIIDAATMDRVIRGLFGRNRQGALVPTFAGLYTQPGERKSADPTAIGRQLFAMNLEAVLQRYPDCRDSNIAPGPCNATLLPTTYRAPRTLTQPLSRPEMIAAYKAMNCLLYQCGEGNVPETELYRELTHAAGELAGSIIRSLPEYEAAPW